jgi:hypothetical protein
VARLNYNTRRAKIFSLGSGDCGEEQSMKKSFSFSVSLFLIGVAMPLAASAETVLTAKNGMMAYVL